MSAADTATTDAGRDFIRDIVQADLDAGRVGQVVTRFPPEPNGYLHIGHAKSICLNFGVAEEFGGRCHLRFDDTNPTKEEQEYHRRDQARRALAGLRLGRASVPCVGLFRAALRMGRASDPRRQGVCRRHAARRDARAARHADRAGAEQPVPRPLGRGEPRPVPRACAPASSPTARACCARRSTWRRGNMNLRDPVLYRILHATHPRTGDAWCIYPTYDFAHGQSDAIEGITHSICTLEFEDHRPLYDWLIENLPVPSRPRQYEFARLNIGYTVLSKRVLTAAGARTGTSPAGTIRGCRRWRACAGAACRRRRCAISCAASASREPTAWSTSRMFEHAVRDVLNQTAPRRMAVLRPLKLVIENYPEGQTETLEAVNNPEDPSAGTRPSHVRAGALSSSATISWRTRRRSSSAWRPGARCGCAMAYFVTCREVVKDAAGEVVGAALHLRSGDARRQRAGRPQGAGDAALGRRRRTRCRRRSGSTSTLFDRPDPGADGGDSWPTSIRTRWKC